MEDHIQAHLYCSPHGILHLKFIAMVSTVTDHVAITAFVGIPVCWLPYEDLGNTFRDLIPWAMAAVWPQDLLRVGCFPVLPDRLKVNAPDWRPSGSSAGAVAWSLQAEAVLAVVWQKAVQLLYCGCVSLPGTNAFYHLVAKEDCCLANPPLSVSKPMLGKLWLLSQINIATSKIQFSLLVATCSWQDWGACAIQSWFDSELPIWGRMQHFWLLFISNKLAADSSIRWHTEKRNSVNAGQVK